VSAPIKRTRIIKRTHQAHLDRTGRHPTIKRTTHRAHWSASSAMHEAMAVIFRRSAGVRRLRTPLGLRRGCLRAEARSERAGRAARRHLPGRNRQAATAIFLPKFGCARGLGFVKFASFAPRRDEIRWRARHSARLL